MACGSRQQQVLQDEEEGEQHGHRSCWASAAWSELTALPTSADRKAHTLAKWSQVRSDAPVSSHAILLRLIDPHSHNLLLLVIS